MKRALLLEFVLGGGLQSQPESEIPDSFRKEGWTMMSAVAHDWRDHTIHHEGLVNSFDLVVPLDPRAFKWFSDTNSEQLFVPLDPEINYLQQWCSLAKDADAVIVIAPECDNILENVVEEIDRVTTRRIGCRNPFLQRACNKLQMAECLRSLDRDSGFEQAEPFHPLTISVATFRDGSEEFQNDSDLWVIKLLDGAGCEGIYRGSSKDVKEWLRNVDSPNRYLVQAWREGQAGSVAVWVSKDRRLWMPPVHQQIEWKASESFPQLDKPQYHGGEGPMPPRLWNEVHRFGDRVLDRLGEGAGGWIGIDFVYRVIDGQLAITAIEVNPRWTTSYVGIRHLYRGNLLLDLLALDHGTWEVSFGSSDCWRTHQVSWHASGEVESKE
ncbi:MAG: hypothetical protein RLY14_1681 [Planctomycetota bacterium]|jgi:predicted ATP-grasp superfamily ATP-dependent carboligase